jgi:hypothetical protein
MRRATDFSTRAASIASYFCHSTVANGAHDQRRKGSGEDQERRIVRLVSGSGMLRRRAARAMLLARLLCARLEDEV